MRIVFLFLLAVIGFAQPAQAVPEQDKFMPVPTLAILYFDNATGVEHLSWLPKGFAQMLIRDVENTGRAAVISRRKIDSVMETYKQSHGTPYTNRLVATRIGKILDATHILTGRFTRHDTDLVIEIKLYETKQSRLIGGRQVEGSSNDLMYLEKQVGLKVFELLKIHLTDRELIDLLQIPTTNHKALAYYSMGLDALDHDDRDMARSHFQASIAADRFFKPSVDAISGMAFVLSGKAILRATVEETAVVGTAGIKSLKDLVELARTNAFDFSIGEPVTTAVEDDTTKANVKLPLQLAVRPDFVNLWLYSIRRLGREMGDAGPTRKLTFSRTDLFDNPVVLSLPESLAAEWLGAWSELKMYLVFQGPDGATLFETPKVPVLPLYIGNADNQFEGAGAVYWQINTAFEVERIPKQFFDEALQVSLEISR